MRSNHSFTAVIIEDEQASQEYLTDLLEINFPEIGILAIEDAVQTAVASVDKLAPDIIFLDIAIRTGSGFDVLNQIQNKMPNVIFTTAYNQYAIDAFRYNAIDYLLKPLKSGQVITAIRKCLNNIKAKHDNEEITRLLHYLQHPLRQQRLPVSTMYGLEFIDMEDILFVEAEGNYSKMKLKAGRSILLSKKIKELELPAPAFVRVHNSYVVNIQYVRKYFKGRGGHIVLDDGSSIPVAPSRKEDFLRLFNPKL